MCIRGLTMKLALSAGIASIALALASPASASIVDYNGTSYNPGDSFTIFFAGQSDGNPVPGLAASLQLTFVGVDVNGDYQFLYLLTNTSTLNPLSEATGFGFNIDPSTFNLGGSDVNGDFTNMSSGSISNGFSVEFCATGGPNCAGGASNGDGVSPGGFDGDFLLAFSGADPGTITLNQPIVRFQSTGTDGRGSAVGVPTTPPVPEPATWAMMILGFGAAGYAVRRRRKFFLRQAA